MASALVTKDRLKRLIPTSYFSKDGKADTKAFLEMLSELNISPKDFEIAEAIVNLKNDSAVNIARSLDVTQHYLSTVPDKLHRLARNYTKAGGERDKIAQRKVRFETIKRKLTPEQKVVAQRRFLQYPPDTRPELAKEFDTTVWEIEKIDILLTQKFAAKKFTRSPAKSS